MDMNQLMHVMACVSAVMTVLSALGGLLHVFKLDEKPWAKIYLAVVADVGKVVKLVADNGAEKKNA